MRITPFLYVHWGRWSYGLHVLSVQGSQFEVVPQWPDGYTEPASVTCQMWTVLPDLLYQ